MSKIDLIELEICNCLVGNWEGLCVEIMNVEGMPGGCFQEGKLEFGARCHLFGNTFHM